MHSVLRFIPDILWKSDPIHLTFFVTRRCNARCPFCFYVNEHVSGDGSDELSIGEMEKVSASMGNLLWLALSGGEIFLRDDLAEICRIFYRNNSPSIILLPTNGISTEKIVSATQKILRQCTQSVVAVKVSMDAVGDKHDRMRGVDGAFDRAEATFRELAGMLDEYSNFELGINTVFSAENEDDVPEVIEYVRGLKGVRTHTVSLVRGEMDDPSYRQADMGKYLAACRRLEEIHDRGEAATYRFTGARLKAAQDVIQRELIHRTATRGQRCLACHAGRLNLVLTETGRAYPCESFKEAHCLGNVREFGYDVRAMLRDGRNAEIIERIGGSCHCTHECYMMTNILFNPRMYPRLLLKYLKGF